MPGLNQNIDIKIEIADNSPEVLAAVETAIKRALWAIGEKATNHAAAYAPYRTGNLSTSIDHEEHEHTTCIGTDVEYAKAQEYGTSRGIVGKHYMQKAVTGHSDEYRNLAKESLQNV